MSTLSENSTQLFVYYEVQTIEYENCYCYPTLVQFTLFCYSPSYEKWHAKCDLELTLKIMHNSTAVSYTDLISRSRPAKPPPRNLLQLRK